MTLAKNAGVGIKSVESCTNMRFDPKPIESALSVARRVTRWRDGGMRLRWCVGGLLRAESKFRSLNGHRGMGSLLKALKRLIRGGHHGRARDVA
jgi:hypothetical protein